MIFKLLFYLFLAYLGYKLIFNLIIPVYRTTRKLKKGFREMQEKMQQQANQQQEQAQRPHEKSKVGEYIDFEEIK